MNLIIDFETRSKVDLPKRGAYLYATDPSTEILCMSWAIDLAPVQLWKPSDKGLPKALLDAIDEGADIYAWNSQFERLLWNGPGVLKYGFPPLELERFICIAALARSRGYPSGLDNASKFQWGESQKDMDGYRVMMRLCKPRDDGSWNNDPYDLDRLYEYCIKDTEAERELKHCFLDYSDEELNSFYRNERLNDRGILCDRRLAEAIAEAVETMSFDANTTVSEITNGAVTSVTQVARLRAWLALEGCELPNLNKGTILDYLEDNAVSDKVRNVLDLRLDSAKASVAKFTAMVNRSGDAGILRGLFMWRGAGQTGRYASTGCQIHNLIRESAPEAIPIFMRQGIKGLKTLGSPMQMFSKMVRPAFIPYPGSSFIIGDYAQIEARIVAWLAGEEWMLEAFREDRDLYCEFGSIAFGKKITKSDTVERAASKACVLGLGFGGGPGALTRSLKIQSNLVLPPSEVEYLVDTYRRANKAIKAYWKKLGNSVLAAVYHPNTKVDVGRVSYLYDGVHLWCKLPSERFMCYPFADIATSNKFEEPVEVVRYRRGNRRPEAGSTDGWPTVDLWHGLLMENLAQAIALDLLDGAIERFESDNRFTVRAHVHDEVIVEASSTQAEALLPCAMQIMGAAPTWSEGLPIKAEGHVALRYTKG